MENSVKIIQFEDVGVHLNQKEIIRGLTFEMGIGGKLLLTGKSGIGKSTIFRLLLGLVRPAKGEIRYRENILDATVVNSVRHEAAYVSQALEIGGGNVDSLLTTILSYHANRHVEQSHERRNRWMDFLELRGDILNEDIETLSGGEKQRIAILIALLLHRKVFLLDEITSYLDEGLKKKVAALFLQETSWTVISISHDPCWRQAVTLQIQRIEMGA